MTRPLAKGLKRLVRAMGLSCLEPKIDEVYTWWTIGEPEEPTDPNLWFAWEEWAKDVGPWRWWFRNDVTQFVSKYVVRPFVDAYWWWMFRFSERHRRHVIRLDVRPGPIPAEDAMFFSWLKILGDYLKRNNFEAQPWDEEVFNELVDIWFTGVTIDEGKDLPEMPELPNGWTWSMTMDPALQDTPFVQEVRRVQGAWSRHEAERAEIKQDLLERMLKVRKFLLS
jgi:hypothetical protein